MIDEGERITTAEMVEEMRAVGRLLRRLNEDVDADVADAAADRLVEQANQLAARERQIEVIQKYPINLLVECEEALRTTEAALHDLQRRYDQMSVMVNPIGPTPDLPTEFDDGWISDSIREHRDELLDHFKKGSQTEAGGSL